VSYCVIPAMSGSLHGSVAGVEASWTPTRSIAKA
jgi:hypothetical protein